MSTYKVKCIFNRKHLTNRKSNSSNQNPTYEEIAAELNVQSVPVYEEVLPKDVALVKMKYTPCEAYEVTKRVSDVHNHDYEDIISTTNDGKTDFSLTKCAAYGNLKSLK